MSAADLSLCRDQCLMARRDLGWTVEELAEKAGAAVAAVEAYEDHPPPYDPTVLAAVRQALEAGGVEFTTSGRGQLTPTAAEESRKRALAEPHNPPLMSEYGAYGVPCRCNRHPCQIDDNELLIVRVAAERLARCSETNVPTALS